MPRAASSFSCAFTSSSPPALPAPQRPTSTTTFFLASRVSPHPHHHRLLPGSSPLPSTIRQRSSSVPQYVTTTRHTLLVRAQDNCPHYSYLKSAPHARERTSARALAASSDAIARRYKDAAERELIVGDGGGWRKMYRRSRASAEPAADFCHRGQKFVLLRESFEDTYRTGKSPV